MASAKRSRTSHTTQAIAETATAPAPPVLKDPPDAEQKIAGLRTKWEEIGRRTGPVDRERAIAGAKQVYQVLGFPFPDRIEICSGPREGADLAAQLLSETTATTRAQAVHYACFGSHEYPWLAEFEWEGMRGNQDLLDRSWGLREVAQSCGWWWALDGAVIFTDRWTEAHFDEQDRFHNTVGPALRYADGTEGYLWHGVTVPKEAIMEPGWLTVEKVMTERNAEVRRALVNLYGPERLMRDANAKKIDAMDDVTLWGIEFADGRRIRMIECINGTQEQDGTFKHYWLRVPPEIDRAWDAAAWTYRIESGDEYKPLKRT